MDLDTLVPAGGGSLSRPVPPRVSEPVATFTQTRAMHPDEIWSPRGSEIGPPQRPLSPPVSYESASAERPVAREHMGDDIPGHLLAAAQVRAALRPGV